MEISISNRQKRVAIDTPKLRRAAQKILRALGWENAEVSIVIVDDEEITRLNRQYFRRRGPTNVIAFPMGDEKVPSLHPQILGDVVISAQTAKRQAEEAGGRGEDEILFLLIHGILHLLGHDHQGPARQRREMEAKEREIFSSFRQTRRNK